MTATQFSYGSTKTGDVRISWLGRHVATLRGARATKFLAEVDRDPRRAQLLMARATGNFKRGNER